MRNEVAIIVDLIQRVRAVESTRNRVVNDCSTDGTRQMLELLPDLRK